jgi:uncharacterized protein YuzE
MTDKKKMIKLKINVAFDKYDVDDEIRVEVDSKGVPVSQFWRRRLLDAKIDNCVEVITQQNKKVDK